ncbi:MAG: HAMP domain-containing sensor histidine kinase [Candidatus Dojkabacteria bacterium]|nr:HAMP domain-containing sensor histidine kinase [Candidatus Dojkabacteria bacterium]
MSKEKDIIDILGHELKTPATVIKLNAQLLEKFSGQIDKDRDEYERYLSRINQAIEEQLELMEMLLTSSGIEGDNIELNIEKVDIKERIELCIDNFSNQAKGKNIRIFNKINSDTPSVLADKIKIMEILNNLIGNAIKFTNKGSITIQTSFDNDYVSVIIKDTGIGIKEEDIPKIWDKFYRVDNDCKTKYSDNINIVKPGGSGLGLYVVYNLIKMMKGDIEVESKYGKGSLFIFRLPVYKD